MTEERAIEVLGIMKSQMKEFGMTARFEGLREMQETAVDVAVKSLLEIQQYRAIGTVEECQEARERIEVMSNTENREETCFIPEKDNPYPLCVGRGEEKCKDCQIRADWEPEDPYGVE